MRLVTIGAILLLSAILVSTIIVIPFYFTSRTTLNRAQMQYEKEKNSPDLKIDEDSQKIIKEVDNKLFLLKDYDKQKNISESVLDTISKNKGETISINSITYDKKIVDETTKNESETISIGGIAQNREELKNFVYRLMNVNTFSNVSVPISNYLKGVDLEFVITLNIKSN